MLVLNDIFQCPHTHLSAVLLITQLAVQGIQVGFQAAEQCFTVTYHPASNSLVERANRKILEVLRPVVGELLETWEDWLPQVALT